MKIFTHQIADTEYTIKVGNNAKENWNLIADSEPEDLWFHLDEYPSAHVIISQKNNMYNGLNGNDEYEKYYPNQIIYIASTYCKSYSKYGKNLSKVKIVYTQIKNLKKGKEVGSVIISKPNYITV